MEIDCFTKSLERCSSWEFHRCWTCRRRPRDSQEHEQATMGEQWECWRQPHVRRGKGLPPTAKLDETSLNPGKPCASLVLGRLPSLQLSRGRAGLCLKSSQEWYKQLLGDLLVAQVVTSGLQSVCWYTQAQLPKAMWIPQRLHPFDEMVQDYFRTDSFQRELACHMLGRRMRWLVHDLFPGVGA